MMQVIPDIQPDMIESTIHSYAMTDSFTGPVPNTIWGYGKLRIRDIILDTGSIAPVEDRSIPAPFSVSPSYPNPFNASVSFDVMKSSTDSPLIVRVYNVLGQKVFESRYEYITTPSMKICWDGIDNNGESASTGLYFFSFTTSGYQINKQALLIR